MIQLYLTRLKCLIKNKENITWTFLFPIILSTFFYMAFTNIYSSLDFQSIKIALVDDQDYLYSKEFHQALTTASTSDAEDSIKLFEVIECDRSEAQSLLDDNEIIGYILQGKDMELVVKSSGFNQTIIKSFLESYTQTMSTLQTIGVSQPDSYPQLIEDISNPLKYIEDTSINTTSSDIVLNYYYALLAMATLFGSYWGLNEIINIQSNFSWKGARVNVAPVSKMKLLLCNMMAALTVHFIGILLLIGYLTFVLNVDFGNNFGYVILTCFMSCILGLSFGTMVTAITKNSENFKRSVLSAIVMFSCFLSGLMVVQMKYIVATKVPFMQYINPAHIITDAFYSLYYYDTYERFNMNVSLMIGYTLCFSLITYFAIRRKTHASL
ncbi:ABC transporter permease [Alkalibaculum sp. M08DMB]|uniref:ABC transporter permease n=1 Tax=Alkalibaculum sporogenes TaxID=2655001 RepID=A0A6A7K8B8_9FIRM|nr:ABC transporter permease [Alkalibaculum sporogenes]MPW25728.1 ABC transporter permease [Alkalibaculum sporogenes]